MSYLFQLYRLVVPKPIRMKILLDSIKKNLLGFYESDPSYIHDAEKKEIIDFVKAHGVEVFPYPFIKNYVKEDIEVFDDQASGMKYVLLDGKRLFFKRRWSKSQIRRSFHALSLEQDENSPHRYLSDDFNISDGDVLADFGSAEGNFSLSVIEKVKKVYLFESDPEWIEALEKTFEPWRDKVEIVQKFVSDIDDDMHCTGDFFFSAREINFLKIDVDGGERKLLKGFEKTIAGDKSLKIALCTYHLHDDEKDFTELLKNNGFVVNPSNGFMIFIYDKKIKPPYLRRALLRAVKQ